MKKLSLVFFGMFIVCYLFSQNYIPLVQENNQWNVMYVIEGGPYTDSTFWTNTYKFEGDTIINNLTYKKVYVSEEDIPVNWTYEGCIREDENQQVFLWKYGNELLRYDFDVEVGDTIEIYPSNNPIQVRVESIDFLNYSGTMRKTILLDYMEYYYPIYEIWIEGIGSNRGILESGTANYIGGWRWLLCFYQNEELVYMNPNYNSCFLFTEIEEVNKSGVEIYPNPADNRITIKNPANAQIESFSIIDLTGNKIKEFNGDNSVLDLSGISNGTYLLIVTLESGQKVEKLIID
jgi:hypothetical protein